MSHEDGQIIKHSLMKTRVVIKTSEINGVQQKEIETSRKKLFRKSVQSQPTSQPFKISFDNNDVHRISCFVLMRNILDSGSIYFVRLFLTGLILINIFLEERHASCSGWSKSSFLSLYGFSQK